MRSHIPWIPKVPRLYIAVIKGRCLRRWHLKLNLKVAIMSVLLFNWLKVIYLLFHKRLLEIHNFKIVGGLMKIINLSQPGTVRLIIKRKIQLRCTGTCNVSSRAFIYLFVFWTWEEKENKGMRATENTLREIYKEEEREYTKIFKYIFHARRISGRTLTKTGSLHTHKCRYHFHPKAQEMYQIPHPRGLTPPPYIVNSATPWIHESSSDRASLVPLHTCLFFFFLFPFQFPMYGPQGVPRLA